MHRVTPTGSAVPLAPRETALSLLAGPTVEPPPPYAGALHDEFAWHAVKYLSDESVLRSEHAVEPTDRLPGALFTFDFAIETPRLAPDGSVTGLRRLAVEIGGSRSLRDHETQLRRDATALAAGACDAIVRLRGTDLLRHTEDVLFLLSRWDPEAFSERGRINLKTLASPEARALSLRPEQPSALVPYPLDGDESEPTRALWHVANGEMPHVLVRRLDARYPSVWAAYASGRVRPASPEPMPLRRTG